MLLYYGMMVVEYFGVHHMYTKIAPPQIRYPGNPIEFS